MSNAGERALARDQLFVEQIARMEVDEEDCIDRQSVEVLDRAGADPTAEQSIVGEPVMKTTGTSRSCARTRSSRRMPFIPGRSMSLRMASKAELSIRRRASSPLAAVSTWYPTRRSARA